ncbi:unnamed protein product [Rotaria socialis]|uniref:Uncharacterized protein n=1 Tax=Rotaria socialis TaxID=392032 RepID=A0A821RYS5_9BILA|nr:unnamed protein product [Rotaria socialis]CAF3783177.1 unnamed protein product [Rotaria socialis]CAF4526566.1 unnamed protein product [Rotaria socialis]CAF4633608.1 unnamed protein product [Rotaria socialis]CAF4846224.1 unnamed protein product [Rotaria socialis]
MSEEIQLIVSTDRTQLKVDNNSGKYYTRSANQQRQDNVKQHQQASISDRNHDSNLAPLNQEEQARAEPTKTKGEKADPESLDPIGSYWILMDPDGS